MRRLLRFLVENPILLVIAVAWLIGMINNARNAMKKARERSALPPPPPGERSPMPAQSMPTRSAEQVQSEMRRILGVEAAEVEPRRAPPPPLPKVPPRTASERHRAWDRPTVEKPPTPVVPRSVAQRRPPRVDSHAGEAMARRASLQPQRAPALGHSQLGDLGGRAHHGADVRVKPGRYALSDLKRIIVLNEILGPPLAMRRSDRDG